MPRWLINDNYCDCLWGALTSLMPNSSRCSDRYMPATIASMTIVIIVLKSNFIVPHSLWLMINHTILYFWKATQADPSGASFNAVWQELSDGYGNSKTLPAGQIIFQTTLCCAYAIEKKQNKKITTIVFFIIWLDYLPWII